MAWSALAPLVPPYMGGQALGQPTPIPNRVGEGFGFLLELLPFFPNLQGESEFK
jgi:hypothetical protein